MTSILDLLQITRLSLDSLIGQALCFKTGRILQAPRVRRSPLETSGGGVQFAGGASRTLRWFGERCIDLPRNRTEARDDEHSLRWSPEAGFTPGV